jgi:hypothetical protein
MSVAQRTPVVALAVKITVQTVLDILEQSMNNIHDISQSPDFSKHYRSFAP